MQIALVLRRPVIVHRHWNTDQRPALNGEWRCVQREAGAGSGGGGEHGPPQPQGLQPQPVAGGVTDFPGVRRRHEEAEAGSFILSISSTCLPFGMVSIETNKIATANGKWRINHESCIVSTPFYSLIVNLLGSRLLSICLCALVCLSSYLMCTAHPPRAVLPLLIARCGAMRRSAERVRVCFFVRAQSCSVPLSAQCSVLI